MEMADIVMVPLFHILLQHDCIQFCSQIAQRIFQFSFVSFSHIQNPFSLLQLVVNDMDLRLEMVMVMVMDMEVIVPTLKNWGW